MKRIKYALVFGLIASVLLTTAVFALSANGDFETGDFTGWTQSHFLNDDFDKDPVSGGVILSEVVGGPDAAPQSLTDKYTNDKLKYPYKGHYSARVNSYQSYNDVKPEYARNGNTISQEITAVLGADGQFHLSLMYAAVMVYPYPPAHQQHDPHDSDELPYFRIQVINTSNIIDNKGDRLVDEYSYVGQPGKGWQDGASFDNEDEGDPGDQWKYIDWTELSVVSSPEHPVKAGDKIKVTITAAGCSQGGHPGYVYVDDIGVPPSSDLSIQATGPDVVPAGWSIEYTYRYNNLSESRYFNPAIEIQPPEGVTFKTLGDADHCQIIEIIGPDDKKVPTVTCAFSGLAPGGSGSFTVTGDVDIKEAGETLIHNEYWISDDAAGISRVTGGPVVTYVTALWVTASGPKTVRPGDQYPYTLTYESTMEFENVQVAVKLPPHTTFSSSDKTCTVAAGVVTCDLGKVTIDKGSFTLTVQVDKLKKVGCQLILNKGDYSISATNFLPVHGLDDVTADVLSPFYDKDPDPNQLDTNHPDFEYIQAIWARDITGGCKWVPGDVPPLHYCPGDPLTRAYAAIMIERAMGNFDPKPDPTGMFVDLPALGYSTPFIEQFYNDKIMEEWEVREACSQSPSPLMYCPGLPVLRAQAAAFIERALGNFTPTPNPSGMFGDVPYPGLEAYTPFIEQLSNDRITGGCKTGYYCPQDNINRADMAVFIARGWKLPMPSCE